MRGKNKFKIISMNIAIIFIGVLILNNFVFKANILKEAEYFIKKNSIKRNDIINEINIDNTIDLIENDTIHIPAWIQ